MVEVPDRYILQDVDTLNDLQQMQAQLKDYEILDLDECHVILEDICMVTAQVKRNSNKVALIAIIIELALVLKDHMVNIAFVRVVALLHDAAKGHSSYDRKGSHIVAEMEFSLAATIICSDMKLPSI